MPCCRARTVIEAIELPLMQDAELNRFAVALFCAAAICATPHTERMVPSKVTAKRCFISNSFVSGRATAGQGLRSHGFNPCGLKAVRHARGGMRFMGII
jgi:hypothetical protein